MAQLLTVSGGRFELEARRAYVLGRGRECEIVAEDMLCSRRHARLQVGATVEILSILDLDSRNGTYVNDKRIKGPTPLAHSDRIRIGTTLYLLSETVGSEETGQPMIDTGTVAQECLMLSDALLGTGRHGSDLAGQIGSFSVIEVLQLLIQTSRSGTLHVALKDAEALVEVRDGEVLAAALGEHEGFDALLELARRTKGIFWLVERGGACKRNVEIPSSRLLFELCCTLDEEQPAARP